MYEVTLDGVLFPIAPSQIRIYNGEKNDTYTLMDGREVSLVWKSDLSNISIETILPQGNFARAVYRDGYKNPGYYIKKIQQIKKDKKPVQLIINRKDNRNKPIYNSGYRVVIENYEIIESADNGMDVLLKLSFKEFSEVRTVSDYGNGITAVLETRETDNKPLKKTYTVMRGDSLWSVSQKCLGDGSRYRELYSWNKNLIDSANNGTGNPTYTIYAGQELVLNK